MKNYSEWQIFIWTALCQFPLIVLAQSDDGDEFSNNLFSDLAPLLTLFGERVATQYLRHSTHPLESVIFACGPLGVLTAITSAIRVGGSRALKAIIGRAEEVDATAEIELLSSTSTSVCELWNGVGVVRVIGKPEILELVIDYQGVEGTPVQRSNAEPESAKQSYGLYTRGQVMHAKHPDDELIDNDNPPNISLNTIGSTIYIWELYVTAAIGVLLQTGVLVFDGFATYYWQWSKGGATVARYAFPLTLIGTMLLVVGIYLCAHIIETSTKELEWVPENSWYCNPLRVLWVQRHQTVGDQAFQSFAIYAPIGARRKHLMTSHRLPQSNKLHKLTWFATSLSVIGMKIINLVQLVGSENSED
ncbi:hypothetical protein BDZ91DRAFT_797276 [Kalaharituber pfeilii]|nr:hypothetical protein BDZ91DRAFT_797276 [Kalaharituber pfeilii]